MKKLVALLLLVVGNVFAFDSTSDYNSANMSYPANSTISQYVVFNSTMQAGGKITFNVDAHAGGGRPLQHDTGNLKLEFYNASGALLGTVQTNFAANLLQMDAWSAAPGDNSAPWVNLNLETTTCGSVGSCSNVSYMKVIMIGTDTSWWAGNYGPQWRIPSVTFNDGANILYNPEFGSYNGTMAQGWTSSSGWGACGTTSGSVMCTTTAAGVTVNMHSTGYDATGGTTSSPAGGYSSTLSASNPTGSTTTTTTQPAAPAFDGTITQVNNPTSDVITSGSTGTAGFTGTQQTRVDAWTNSTQSKNNVLYITQTYGANNDITITQSGVKNRIDFTLDGNGNVANTTQTGSNYLKEEIPGWGNNITINQSNTTLTNYAETKIQGNGNTVNHIQTGPGNHILFSSSAGDINTINSTQTGNAGHYLEVKMSGNFNSVVSNQTGNTTNKANIDLTNAGGAASVDLGQTGGKNFTIIQSCANPAGCTTTVRQ